MFSNTTHLSITYSGNAPSRVYEQLLQNSSYQNTLDEPRPGTKRVDIWAFTLAAGDTGTSASSNVATVFITVVPVNDNLPVFTQQLYRGSIQENAPSVGVTIGVTAEATDADTHGNTNIRFTSSDDRFFVEPVTGIVIATVSFDAESATSVNFTISASDGDSPEMTASVPVVVTISDVNDNPPIFQRSSYAVDVNESLAIGATILRVIATDRDVSEQFSNITYRLTIQEELVGSGSGQLLPTGPPSTVPFAVDLMTGAITLTASLDHDEGQRTYNFTIVASDSVTTPLSASAQVTVNVLDANDNPPQFTNPLFSFVVEENVFPFDVVQLMARDADPGLNGEIRFSLEGTTAFAVDSVSGIVSLRQPLDYETTSSFTFMVTVTDLGSPPLSSTENFIVNIRNVNDNPPTFTRPPGPSVTYNISENSVFTQEIQATDRDGDSIIYLLIGGPEFDINPFTGMIASVAPLDYESQSAYNFIVEASDRMFTERLNVTVIVLDVNDNTPVFTNLPYNFIVQENLFPHIVFQAMARDDDSGTNGEIRYELADTGNFSVNPTTGVVTLNGPLDYEVISMYSFLIIARDLGSPSRSSAETITVRVDNANDNSPVFVAPMGPRVSFSVHENTIFREQVAATDADGDSILYSLSEGQGFEIDLFTGVITSTMALDFERQRSYNFTVEARDSTFTARLYVTVNVLDVDDNRPVFRQRVYSEEVPENLPIGSLVVQLRADDGDSGENAVLVYSLLETQVPFSINAATGDISLSSMLDFNAGPRMYNFSVSVSNPAPSESGADTASVIVTVQDINNLIPVLSLAQTNVTFVENSEPILVVPEIVVRDEDSSVHPLAACRATFTRSCPSSQLAPCSESISVDENLAMQLGLSVQSEETESEQVIGIRGNSSEMSYQSILRTLQYSNVAPEPSPGRRSVAIRCRDQDFMSNVVRVSVAVLIRNEFCPVITVNTSTLNFTESTNNSSLNVGELVGLALRDEDSRPHRTLLNLTVTLSNRPDASDEFLAITNSSGLVVSSSSDIDFFPMTGSGSGQEVPAQTIYLRSPGRPRSIRNFMRALRSLVYVNNRSEPSLMPRTITITPMDPTSNCVPVGVTINIVPLNDNPPSITLVVNSPQEYLENSGPLAFARQAGLMISDLDHNRLFPLVAATVRLSGLRDLPDETLSYNSSLVPAGVTPIMTLQEGM